MDQNGGERREEERRERERKKERRERKREDESSFLYPSHQCHRMTSTMEEKFDPLFHTFPHLYLSIIIIIKRERERVREREDRKKFRWKKYGFENEPESEFMIGK